MGNSCDHDLHSIASNTVHHRSSHCLHQNREVVNTKAKLAVPFLFLFVSLVLILPVHAEGEVELANVPAYLSEQLGIALFPAQLLASALLISLVVFPLSLLTKGKHMYVLLSMVFLMMGISIALTWLPFWFLIILVFGVAGTFSVRMKDVFT